MNITFANGSIASGIAINDFYWKPSLPEPTKLQNYWGINDAPRFIPPEWNTTPPPEDTDLGPLTNTSGFDLR